MNSGLYSALSGAVGATERLDTVASNIANAATGGFKRDRITFENLLESAGKNGPVDDTPRFVSSKQGVDHAPGPVRRTDNRFDLAIEGDGFFSVQTPSGIAYTRQGNFRLDGERRLVTSDGYPLLAGGGAVTIPPTAKSVVVEPSGVIRVDGATRGTLDVVDFPKPYRLAKEGAGLFRPVDGVAPIRAGAPRIAQGYLEDSNVSAVREMVDLIDTNRHYEACTRAIRSFDDITARAVNDLGKV